MKTGRMRQIANMLANLSTELMKETISKYNDEHIVVLFEDVKKSAITALYIANEEEKKCQV